MNRSKFYFSLQSLEADEFLLYYLFDREKADDSTYDKISVCFERIFSKPKNPLVS